MRNFNSASNFVDIEELINSLNIDQFLADIFGARNQTNY